MQEMQGGRGFKPQAEGRLFVQPTDDLITLVRPLPLIKQHT